MIRRMEHIRWDRLRGRLGFPRGSGWNNGSLVLGVMWFASVSAFPIGSMIEDVRCPVGDVRLLAGDAWCCLSWIKYGGNVHSLVAVVSVLHRQMRIPCAHWQFTTSEVAAAHMLVASWCIIWFRLLCVFSRVRCRRWTGRIPSFLRRKVGLKGGSH